MTKLDISRVRLQNQGLTGEPFSQPEEVVRWLLAVQAQDFAGAKWALGLRLQDDSLAAIEQAYAQGTILRTHLLRPTWHFVTPADIRWLLALTAPRVHSVNAFMYRKLELDADIFSRSNTEFGKALQGGKQLTRVELQETLEKAGIPSRGELRMVYFLMRAELDGIICSGARRGSQFTYALLDERVPHSRTLSQNEALAELARRYFMSRGPATVYDFAKWSGLTIADARHGLEEVKTQFQQEQIDGQTYWFSSPASPPAETMPTAFLLSIYDEYISGYKNHSTMAASGISEKLIAMGNLLRYIIVVNGQVVGTFRRTLRKDAVVIETNFFNQLTEAENLAVGKAAARFGAFLGLNVVMQ